MSEPFIGLVAAAAVTTRLKLKMGISFAAEYDPIVQAKQTASLERLPQDRFLSGGGAGEHLEKKCAIIIRCPSVDGPS